MTLRYLMSALLLAGAAASPGPQDRDGPYLNEAPPKFLERFERQAQALNWKGIFELYDHGLAKYADRFAPTSDDRKRYLSLGEVLRRRMQLLPGIEAAFRERYDGPAAGAFRRAHEAGDPALLEEAADRYFLASGAVERLDRLANRNFAEGRVGESVPLWEKVLGRLRPSSKLVPVVTCRLAKAYSLLRDARALQELRRQGLEGKVLVGARSLSVREYIDTLPTNEPPVDDRSPFPPTGEVPLGRFALYESAGHPPTANVDLRSAYARLPDREVILLTTGRRILALDPGRGDGASLQQGLYWRFPESGAVRGSGLVYLRYGAVIGCAVAGDVVYGTLLSDRVLTQPTRGRRRWYPLDGPTRVVALDIRTGRELWDTDKIVVPYRGRRVPLLESLPLGGRSFIFTSVPILRNGRLYLTAMTNPGGDREAYLFCLDATTGLPLWHRFAASVPPHPSEVVMPFPRILAARGAVYVATNVGAVVAFRARTGDPLWATVYSREPAFLRRTAHRKASPPILQGGSLYVLAQDTERLLEFEPGTGRPREGIWEKRGMHWGEITHLAGADGKWLLLAGNTTYVASFSRRKIYEGGWNTFRMPAAGFTPTRIFLPFLEGHRKGVVILDRKTELKRVGHFFIDTPHAVSDFLVAGGYLIFVSNTVDIFTGLDSLRRRGRQENEPSASSLLLLARILRNAGRWKEAAETYRRFFSKAGEDPRWSKVVQEAKWWMKSVGQEP